MNKIRWGIVSTARITHQFAQDFAFVQNGALHAVSSRSQAAADAFARQYDIPRAYADYHAMLDDADIDAVYIATPHNNHFQNTADAIAAGKAVLCEKPFTVNAGECRELMGRTSDSGVYVMEAMWTWFLPAIRKAKEWVDAGRIGRILHIKADFGYPLPYDPDRREYCVDNAGGCLLEMGIYPVALACLFLPEDPDTVHTITRTAPNGVEDDVVTLWNYRDTVVSLATSFRAKLQNWAYIIGERGYIAIPDFWRASECQLFELDTKIDHFQDGRTSLGFNYEISSASGDIQLGRTQSAIIPLSSSLRFQLLMARVRAGG
jgi:predicted dehydrogenase